MRRGYWTGFIMGGMLGMLAARVYGDRLMDSLLPGMMGNSPMDDGIGMEDDKETESDLSSRPLRGRRRYRRTF